MFPALFCLLALATTQAFSFPSVSSRLYHAPTTISAPVPFSLSKTLGDHMVLQRDTPSTVWGFAPVGATIKTTFAGTQYSSTAGSDTIWRQQLPATAASAVGQTISFSASTGEAAALQDVIFGDVYICSGRACSCFCAPPPPPPPTFPMLP